MIASLRRLYGFWLRHYYAVKGSAPDLVNYILYPVIVTLTWGFLNRYLLQNAEPNSLSMSAFLGAAILFLFFERNSMWVMGGFQRDISARNVSNLFITRLSPLEFLFGLIICSAAFTTLIISVSVLTVYFVFQYNIFLLGFSLFFIIVNLIMSSMTIGTFMLSMLLRFGTRAQTLAWTLAWVLMPFICIYYPLSSLSPVLQNFAKILPPTYAFEDLRHLSLTGQLQPGLFTTGFALNILFLSMTVGNFLYQLRVARQRGTLMNMGE